ncbi:hypothetical protein D9615_006941 [Tricholomella constricta]|uniref:HAT C-terminal dimerisation domain-containing protein n=1 Tax=Tricholomella constricta TaxID=117010 RepID=A0A8H5H8E3_9AGAR|nr:hypothetical protein D9615_006941 [Tricholomella constricta]
MSSTTTPYPLQAYPPHPHQYTQAPPQQPSYYTYQHPGHYHSGTAYYPAPTPIPPLRFYSATAPQTPAPQPLTQQPNGTRRKRANGNATANHTAKRRRQNQENCAPAAHTNSSSAPNNLSSSARPQYPAVYGVGPIPPVDNLQEPRVNEFTFESFGSVATKSKKSSSVASDVWYCTMRAISKDKPNTVNRPSQMELYRERPKDALYCVEGQTASIRDHLHMKHWKVYRELVVAEKLKGWEETARLGPDYRPNGSETHNTADREPFTLQGFYSRLAKWIAVDDQSINVIESPELRELLLFLGTQLTDRDIPHRTKLTEIIIDCFKTEYKAMNALGRVSLTSDVWSRTSLAAHVAITAHYMAMSSDGHLVLRSRLVAFRQLEGSHTGENLAKVLWKVINELQIVERIGMITLDNASNNNTLMEELEYLFPTSQRMPSSFLMFDRDGNHIRCFPHVTNIAVKTGVKRITELAEEDVEVLLEEIEEVTEHEPTCDDLEYLDALQSDVVAAARKLVSACRSSGQRREDLKDTIETGNLTGIFSAKGIRVVALLRDVDTRWSSMFLMIDRVLELYPAIKIMLEKPKYTELQNLLLDDMQLRVLNDIRSFLYVFHTVQEVVSADKTPTLSVVLPLYERLISMLRDLKRSIPNLAHVISASQDKLEEYLSKSRKTRIYSLAMLINPTIKLQWAEMHWSSTDDFTNAKKSILDAMLEHYQAMRTMPNTSSMLPRTAGRRPITVGSHASRAQSSGFARFNALAKSLSSGSVTETETSDSVEAPPSGLSSEEQAAHDKATVNEEFRRWLASGLITDARELEELDLVRFWQNKKFEFPILYRIALDVLPVQVSAVPCERVFSSSKETDALRRSNLSPEMMEILQILKYLIRCDRLNFTEGLLAKEEECMVLDVEPSVLRNFLTSGDIEGLEALVGSST